jgi:NAD(P)-dependent dehydrogenase (short-subunit alcohol dehydrogenase family)
MLRGALACDVTDPKACEGAVGDVIARWGGFDVLVNNVGVGGPRGTAIEVEVEGTGWDVGKAVVYLASEQARWLTGVVLPVDVGTTAGFSLPRSQEGG